MDKTVDEELGDDLIKVPYKLEHGLSKEEQVWFQKWFDEITKLQQKQNQILGGIKSWITFMGLMVILSVIFAACSALGIR
jgi:hypothetical protein